MLYLLTCACRPRWGPCLSQEAPSGHNVISIYQTQQQRRKRRSSQPAAPQPHSLRGTVQLEAWQELLRQDAAVQELSIIQCAADAATCAGDIHIIGEQFDALIERTQAEVLAASSSAKGRGNGNSSTKDQPAWWDKQLAAGRRAARQAIRRDPKSHAARQARAEFQRLLRRKQGLGPSHCAAQPRAGQPCAFLEEVQAS